MDVRAQQSNDVPTPVVGLFANVANAAGPYANYQILRSQGPIHWCDDLFDGAWVLTTFQGVRDALRDSRLSARRTGGWVMRTTGRHRNEREKRLALQRCLSRSMLFLDNPKHHRLRMAIQAGFRLSNIDALRPFARQSVQELLSKAEIVCSENGNFDFVETVARILPTRIIMKLLGLPSDEEADFLVWSKKIATFLGSTNPSSSDVMEAQEGIVGITQSIRRSIRSLSRGLYGSLILALKQESDSDEAIAELTVQCAMLLFAGLETTRHLLSTGAYWISKQPDFWTAAKNDPKILKPWVRELLRWDSPVQYTGRRANSDFELFGRKIRRGQLVLPLIGSANRDPAEYAEPDDMRIDRRLTLPLSFGFGTHVCVGAGLTMMEAEVAFEEMVRRWDALKPVGGETDWVAAPLYRGPLRLLFSIN
ncbi:MAG: cytochrome P450 [Hyphomicrobiaceae bacterium]